MVIVLILNWFYLKVDFLTGEMFKLFGFIPEHNLFMWNFIGLVLMISIIFIVGVIVETKIVSFFTNLLHKIPGYKTIKDLVNIFDTSKSGEQQVLVVMIKGFSTNGYNVGLMYSLKESIIKEHYSVVLSQTPLPNGGYIFEEHKKDILVVKEATFNDNLQYLLSIGTKSLPEIIGTDSVNLEKLPTFEEYLKIKS
jgi:uncharacterized membrane protein